jgi:acetyl esterase/lipase
MAVTTRRGMDYVRSLLGKHFGAPAATIAEVRRRFELLAGDLPSVTGVHIDEVSANGVPAQWVTVSESQERPILFFVHGGGYNCGSPAVYRDFMARLATAARGRVFGVEYRLAPENRFPAAVDDAVAAYRWLIESGADANSVVTVGDSAGGGLNLALLVALRDQQLRLPTGAICISPWVDLKGLGESMITKAATDPWIRPDRVSISTNLYIGRGGDVRHPLAAPLYADLSGLPPLQIIVGSEEVLLDDSTRIAERARAAGVEVDLQIWQNMIHVFPFFAGVLDEGKRAMDVMGAFARDRTGVN